MKRIAVLLAACAMSSGASAQVPGNSLPPYLVDRMPSWPSAPYTDDLMPRYLPADGNLPSCRTFDQKKCVMLFSLERKEERVDCLVDAKDQFTCHRTEKPAPVPACVEAGNGLDCALPQNDNAKVWPGVPMTYTDLPSQLPWMQIDIVPGSGTQVFHLHKDGKMDKLPAARPLVSEGIKLKFVDTTSDRDFLAFQRLAGKDGTEARYSISKSGKVYVAPDLRPDERFELCRHLKAMGIRHEVCK